MTLVKYWSHFLYSNDGSGPARGSQRRGARSPTAPARHAADLSSGRTGRKLILNAALPETESEEQS